MLKRKHYLSGTYPIVAFIWTKPDLYVIRSLQLKAAGLNTLFKEYAVCVLNSATQDAPEECVFLKKGYCSSQSHAAAAPNHKHPNSQLLLELLAMHPKNTKNKFSQERDIFTTNIKYSNDSPHSSPQTTVCIFVVVVLMW